MADREQTDAMGHSGGVVIDSMAAKDALSNWRGPPHYVNVRLAKFIA